MDERMRIIIIAAVAVVVVGTGLIYYFATSKPTRTVTMTINGNGKVLLGAAGAYLTTLQVNDGDSLTLVATPDTGWTFSQWSGDASGNTNPLNIIVSKDLKITATFTK